MLLHPQDSPGKNTDVGCHFLLQGIFTTQGLNPYFLHWQMGSSLTVPPGKPSLCYTFTQNLNSYIFTWIPSTYNLLWMYIMKGCWISSNAFFCIYSDDHIFLSFILLMWYITFIDLHMLNYSCIFGINPTWPWCISLLMFYWIWSTNIVFKCLHLYSPGILVCCFFFL